MDDTITSSKFTTTVAQYLCTKPISQGGRVQIRLHHEFITCTGQAYGPGKTGVFYSESSSLVPFQQFSISLITNVI